MASRKRKRRLGATVFVLVVVLSGTYLWADATGLVPGYLTTDPPPAAAAAFPDPPGAVAATDLAAAPTGATSSTPKTTADIAGGIAKLADDKDAMGKSFAAVVTDAVTGDVIAAKNIDKPMTPASTQKILTAVAAFDSLDPTSTLTTKVVQASATQVVIVGGGDMMLSAKKGKPTEINGRAGLGDLATQVAQKLATAGDTEVTVGYDSSLFDSNTHGVWSQSPAEGYAAPVVPLAVDTGRMKEGEYAPRYNDPDLEAAKVFAKRLAEKGITVTGGPTRVTAGADATELGSVHSAPIEQIVSYFLDHSDNTITEVVGRLVAIQRGLPASFDGATKAVLATLGEQGIDVSKAHLTDCSGLADGSKVTARTLLAAVTALATPGDGTYHDAAAGLPISGWTGTLADRMTSEQARGNVRAKTGTLPKVVALAGTVQTKTQRPLNFVLIADKSPSTWASRKRIDDFVSGLTG
ncbi:D-alanyl-D-alanine carboxypeptidase/D-alanyl-D-alanine endopeptidase [Rarobacter incanus]|uniref:D-alanyl-D-alanine carboxypeptidase/D-alanyl-D-alanine-endopeptidase (Penicillin-binding protein 4) n=1 Tax=Rarobacter incanus TaxID=153494 RepID=A0A542SP22_9MICO|nr:D-alanyl-D-alanine carboxypeptidase/D-alanyl-D-alanine-endopeptidase [Rarobacter incanus]TQK76370.1 D-alanyl-D-alanine carboxypeptidase/D-alanyl-D-alanine-endopeptidase (penicillin-binding protein 4) [Rarobacter incanus]